MVPRQSGRRIVLVTAAVAVAAGVFVNAQVAPTPGQSDPTAVCPTDLNDQIQTCRVQVWSNEANLPQGPCYSSDWACICNVQQGLLACYAPCPGNTPQTDIDFNNAQCAGQNGVSNAAAVAGGAEYSGGVLTTTGGGAVVSTTAAASTAMATVPPTTPSTSSSTTAPAVINTGDTTTTVSTGVTTTLPRTSSSNTVSNPKDIPTPVQSTSANVFGGQAGGNGAGGNTGGAVKQMTLVGGGGVQGGLLLGLVGVLLLW